MRLARRVQNIEKSITLEITARAKELKQDGYDVINFAAGEPDFDTPDFIKKSAIQAINDGFTKYTPSTGITELKQIISEKFKRENQLDYPPNQIIVSSGAKHSLYNIFQAIVEKNDQVIISSPYWVSYPEMIKLAGATPKILKTRQDDNFKINIKKLKKAITSKTKALIINSPSNPTGSVYSKSELGQIAELCLSSKIFIISDEIYEKLIYDGKEHISIGSLNKKLLDFTITVNGVSKAFSMTGWRIGYLGGPSEIISAIAKIQSHSTSNPASISQKAAYAALNGDRNCTEQIRLDFQKRRDYICERLGEISKITFLRPQGAFYVFCNISKTKLNSVSFAKKFLQDEKVAVVPGKGFGCDDFIRISFATNIENIARGIDRLKKWVRQ